METGSRKNPEQNGAQTVHAVRASRKREISEIGITCVQMGAPVHRRACQHPLLPKRLSLRPTSFALPHSAFLSLSTCRHHVRVIVYMKTA